MWMKTSMELSKKEVYALQLVQELDTSTLCVSGIDVANRLSISPAHLAQIVRPLVRAGLVEALRGPGGGYTLKRPAAKISVIDVLNAMAPDRCQDHPDETESMTRIRQAVCRLVSLSLKTKPVTAI